MIEDFIVARGVCTDQWWPPEDDDYADPCPDQRFPPGMPDVMGWDRLGSNPISDVLTWVQQWMVQSGSYLIYGGRQYGKSKHASIPSDHNPSVVTAGPGVMTYGGQTMPIRGFDISGAILDEVETMARETFAWHFADPYIEKPQTRADILAWKKSRGSGPPKKQFNKRGRDKK